MSDARISQNSAHEREAAPTAKKTARVVGRNKKINPKELNNIGDYLVPNKRIGSTAKVYAPERAKGRFYTVDWGDCTLRMTGSMIFNGSLLSTGNTVVVWSVKRRGNRFTITRTRPAERFISAHSISPTVLAMLYSVMVGGEFSTNTEEG